MQEENIGNFKINKIVLNGDKKIVFIKKDSYEIYNYYFDDLNIKEGLEYDCSKLDEIKKVVEQSKIMDYILSLTRKKIKTCYEIKNKCLKKFDNEKNIDEAISLLKKYKVIDDKFFVEAYLYVLNEECYGKYYIINFFKHKNVEESIIKTLIFDEESEIEKARKYFEEVKNFYVSTNYVKQKKKIYDCLLKRGFDVEIILNLLYNLKINKEKEYKILEKDYSKMKDKYSKKYTGRELNNKIVNALISKGYNYSDISEFINSEEN